MTTESERQAHVETHRELGEVIREALRVNGAMSFHPALRFDVGEETARRLPGTRWLAEHDRQIAEKTLREYADTLAGYTLNFASAEALLDQILHLLRRDGGACICDFPAASHALYCPLRPVADDARTAIVRSFPAHRADVATERLRIARAVAEHWHTDAVSHLDDALKAHYTVAGHALSCVLAALDGKTAAGDLGMPEGWTA
jgi:hypothetical protein